MAAKKTTKHILNFEKYLKTAKLDFDRRWNCDLTPNASFDDFSMVKTVGAGSFGQVMLAKSVTNPDKLYAIKVIEKKRVVKSKNIVNAIAEIRILDAVRFQFLIFMEYFSKDNVYLYIIMPFINGGDVFTHLRRFHKFDEATSKFFAAQVILALEYMHNLGLIHRDLKPENILVNDDGYLKLTDYGFCKKVGDERTYTLCGTAEYLAPEIILSQGYNKSVDWWAFGVLTFELNAGFPPFRAKEPMDIYEKIVAGKFYMPSYFTQPLKDFVFNTLQADKTKRFGLLKNGTKDFKMHQWFGEIDWDEILKKQFKPPFKPFLKGPTDISNFEWYQEVPMRKSSIEEYAKEFANFNSEPIRSKQKKM